MLVKCPICKEVYRPAKSKRESLCPNCKSISETGKSLKEIAREKSRASLEKSRLKSQERQTKKPKTAYKIPKFSAKGAKQAREVTATKRRVKAEAADGQSFVECAGCGKFFRGLDGSHVVPVSQSSVLAANSENITLLCRGCHTDFEHGTVPQMIKLKCFIKDMTTMFEFDNSRFWNIFYRLIDEHNLMPTPALERVISKLERVLGKVEKFETQTEQ